MFGLSLPKILLTAAVVCVVWLLYKRWAGIKTKLRAGRKREKGLSESSTGTVEDLIQCRVCGTFVSSKGPVDCDRADCPYG